ncbi:uncharacterized protein Tco025E_09296, partial [Trypanosoma conorhini]
RPTQVRRGARATPRQNQLPCTRQRGCLRTRAIHDEAPALAFGSCGDNGGPLSFLCAAAAGGGADVRHPRGCVLNFPQRCLRRFASRLVVCVRGAGAAKK